MYWAVLFHRFGKYTWWANSIGARVVLDIERTLRVGYPEIIAAPEWRDGIEWAREQVGFGETNSVGVTAGLLQEHTSC